MWVGDRLRRVRSLAAAAGWGVVLAGCASGGTSSGGGNPAEVEFAPELGIVLDQMTLTEDGLYYADLELGEGPEAQDGEGVAIHYTGWLPDGTAFDSSVETDDPIVFVLGQRQVIRGWELGIEGMRVGGRRILVIPPRLGYGSRGVPGVVPRNATLVFTVLLLDVGRGDAPAWYPS